MVFILGIDLSKAFDTITRSKLLFILKGIVDEDEMRMIAKLLTSTSSSVRIGSCEDDPFFTNRGVPQGDSLSPILFIVYLEAALRDVCCQLDISMNDLIAYADDSDFILDNVVLLDIIQSKAPAIFEKWGLQMNVGKTDVTIVWRQKKKDEKWRLTRKLGSLIGEEEDVKRRKVLARIAFNNMTKIWKNIGKVSEKVRLRLYNAYVRPVLLYNSGTWGLLESSIVQIETFHRRQLRRVLGIFHPQRIGNDDLYRRCNSRPLRLDIMESRWKLFGHVLRLDPDTPCNRHMVDYFDPIKKGT